MTSLRMFLDASTAHLPQRFYSRGVRLTGAHRTEVGMLLWVPPDDGGPADGDNAPEIIELRRFARAAGAAYVFLDRDAERISGLPVYDS